LGDTIYVCKEVDVPDDFNYFIPNSQLSEMRRQLVAELSQEKPRIQTPVLQKEKQKVEGEKYPHPYLYNISNRLSQQFYGATSLTAYELKGGNGPIMQCRHCIRYSLGYCVKHGGKRPSWHEPLSLVLGDGRRFRLEFDCQHCQMNVYAEIR
jgi:putative protease